MNRQLFLIFCCVSLITGQNFDTFKNDMEDKVTNLADQMSRIYGNRCDSNILNCQTLSYNQCEGTDEKMCYDDFPKPSSCVDGGAYLSKTSATRFPNHVDINNLHEQERHFVCTSALMETEFQKLNNGRDKQYGSAFIGSLEGSMRAYPTFRQAQGDQCVDYDPRYRPWYVAATSGGKNLVLIIDVSGSMDGTRISLAKQAAKSVVNTLSNNDFLGVIVFSSSAQPVLSTTITRATIAHKQSLNLQLDQLVANGQTNYEAAIRLGFNMLSSAQNDQFGAPCANAENIFLFLTDGEPTLGQTSSSGLRSIIDSLNSFGVTIFTYGLGSGIDRTILEDMACNYNGIMFSVSDSSTSSQLTTIMRSYYIYMAEGISLTSPVWTQPYEDFFGFGRLITVSMPIYYEESSIRKILGVVGIDVSMSTFNKFGYTDETEITKLLISNTPCLQSTLTNCQLEQLRPSNSKCGVNGCVATGSITQCSGQVQSNIFLAAKNTSSSKCCGLTVGALVGIIIGVVVFVGIIIGVLIYKWKKGREAKALQQNSSNNKANNSAIIIQDNSHINFQQQQQQQQQQYYPQYHQQQQPYGQAPQYQNPYDPNQQYPQPVYQ